MWAHICAVLIEIFNFIVITNDQLTEQHRIILMKIENSDVHTKNDHRNFNKNHMRELQFQSKTAGFY